MTIWLITAFWILLGLGVFFAAFAGSRRSDAPSRLSFETRGRRFNVVVLAVVYLGFGIAIPAAVLLDNLEEEESGGEAAAPTQLSASGEAGKQLFVETCGGCHILKAAGTTGAIGPSLDTVAPDLARVEQAIKIGGTGSGRMPPTLLKGKQAKDVAEYVSSVAGK